MAKHVPGTGKRNGKQGMHWIRTSTRLAIYHRDRFCCVYCGSPGEDHGVGLTLDHLVPVELGGGNDPSNLVTACQRCNCAKGARTVRGWLAWLREHDIDASRVARRIRALVQRPIDRREGRRLEAARASLT